MPSFRVDVTDEDALVGSIEADFEIWCSECGTGLCHAVSDRNGRNNGKFLIEPCAKCLRAAREEGEEAGYSRGSCA